MPTRLVAGRSNDLFRASAAAAAEVVSAAWSLPLKYSFDIQIIPCVRMARKVSAALSFCIFAFNGMLR